MDASGIYHPEQPRTFLQEDKEEMIFDLLVAGAFALATLRRCVYIVEILCTFSNAHIYISLSHRLAEMRYSPRANICQQQTKTFRGYYVALARVAFFFRRHILQRYFAPGVDVSARSHCAFRRMKIATHFCHAEFAELNEGK